MSDNEAREQAPSWQWQLSAIVCIAGLAAAVWIVRVGLRGHTVVPVADVSIEDPAAIGTTATFTINGATISMRLARMDWAINPGAKIDSQIVSGPIEAVFQVTFISGPVHMAYIGVEVQGGSVIVLREGRVLLSTYADQKPVTRMTTTPESFGPHQQHIELQFKGDGTGPMHVRALWKPVDADEPTQLPSEPAITPATKGTADER